MSAIHIKSPALTLKAGPRALARIRQNGLSPADVGILPGAAGGPKGIGIQGLDLALPSAPGASPVPACPIRQSGFDDSASCTPLSASPRA
jgi:hypothetical protein